MNFELLLGLALKSFVAPLICLVGLALWRKASSAARRLAWVLCLASLIFLPLAALSLPVIQVVEPQPVASAGVPVPTSPLPLPSRQLGPRTVERAVATALAPAPGNAARAPLDWPAILGAVWLAGASLLLLPWLFGMVRLARLRISSCEDPVLHSDLIEASRRTGTRRIPAIGFCTGIDVPMTFGAIRPCLVLPADALNWDGALRRAILTHECAHIRRQDWAIQRLAHLVKAVYWFNPLVWIAVSRLRLESEAAADDMVLQSGVSPSDYASELLRLAVGLRTRPLAGAVAILEGKPLKPRIERLLDSGRYRGRASLSSVALAVILSLAVAVGLGLSYRHVSGALPSHDGYVEVGKGRHLRLVAIVERTGAGTRAWNLRGELLPNSVRLPDNLEAMQGQRTNPGPGTRYLIFAKNFPDSSPWVDAAGKNLSVSSVISTVVPSQKSGFGFMLGRIDGDEVEVVRLDSATSPARVSATVPVEGVQIVDTIIANGTKKIVHTSPIAWSATEFSPGEWLKSLSPENRPHIKLYPLSNKVRIDLNVPKDWSDRVVAIQFGRGGFLLRGVPGRTGLLSFTIGQSLEQVVRISVATWRERKVSFDSIPLEPSHGVAQTAALDVDEVDGPPTEGQPGELVGIADPHHPEWGFWSPDGRPLPAIPQVGVPGVTDEPVGNPVRQLDLLFRNNPTHDGIRVADASGNSLVGSVDFVKTSRASYQICTAFVDPKVQSLPLYARLAGPEVFAGRTKLTRTTVSDLAKISPSLSNGGGRGPLFTFDNSIRAGSDPLARTLEFEYSNGPAPIEAVPGYVTDWNVGLVGVNALHPEKLVAAKVFYHGYRFVRYPRVDLFPGSGNQVSR